MGIFLLLALIADGVILVASQARPQPWARQVCNATINLCDHPAGLLVAAVILVGVFLIQRH